MRAFSVDRLRRWARAGLAALAFILLAPLPAQADQDVTIKQVSSGRFLDAKQGGDFPVVVTTDDNRSRNLVWTMTLHKGNVYSFSQVKTKRLLTAYAWRTETRDYIVGTSPMKGTQISSAQLWEVVSNGSGAVTLKLVDGGRFLDAHEVPELNFAAVTRPRQDDATQLWLITPLAVPPPVADLRPPQTPEPTSTGARRGRIQLANGKCLDVYAPDMRRNGGRVQLWSCNSQSQQVWTYNRVTRSIRNEGGLCLDAHAPDMTVNGGRVQLWLCNGSPQQSWTLDGNRNVQLSSGLCLDARAAEQQSDGGGVQMWTCNNELQQKWQFIAAGR